ncbi:PIG-L family deacetylase [Heliobacterium chlorum]|uniref:PIG-L family deacetylase n=1 Tax=Heliobacterium chlorum TaxID=2698 RepID=A0ABR7T3H6_HELCL|nr:PIG-L family deacetylase [Heliobacterium chlorum]MBC9784672.1 PIG-L family deacetylase [Heliobacterium chlorum]
MVEQAEWIRRDGQLETNREKRFAGKRLMAILAHPDDESFGMGGTLARYKDLGVETVLVCATRGEAGKCGDPPLCWPEDLGQFREEETRRACAVLQIDHLHFLDYRDQDTNVAPPWEIVGKMIALIRRYRPDVLVTFGPEGLSGHKDHTSISHYATMAYLLSGSTDAYRGYEPYQCPYLYYICLHPGISRTMGRGFSRPTSQIHVAVPVRQYLPQKRAAIDCHQTQIGSIRRIGYLSGPSIDDPEVDQLRSFEYYHQVFPQIPLRDDGEGMRSELFE